MKRLILIACGLLLIITSLLIPFIFVEDAITKASEIGIIGGADAPTYALVYWLTYSQFKLGIFTFAGIIAVLFGIAQKNKRR